jgi:cardiolipin synthase
MARASRHARHHALIYNACSMTVLTAANQLTLLRLVLVPVFALCMLYGLAGWALVTFAVAGVTDLFDGLIARRTGQLTTLGAWLDPMADKLLVATMFVMLTVPGLGFAVRLPLWLTVLVLSRDIAIVLTVAIVNLAVARRTFKPTFLGKAATAVYVLTGLVALCANFLGERFWLVDGFIYTSLALTLASGAQYVAHIARGVTVEQKPEA